MSTLAKCIMNRIKTGLEHKGKCIGVFYLFLDWRYWSAVPDYSTKCNPELLSCWNSIREAQWIHLNTSHWDLHDSCDELTSEFVRLAFTAARLFWTSLEPNRQVVPPCKYCTFCIVRCTAIHRFCEREDRETFYLNQRSLRTLKGEVPEQPVGGAETKRNPVRRNLPPSTLICIHFLCLMNTECSCTTQ